jgi:hypothetical protein
MRRQRQRQLRQPSGHFASVTGGNGNQATHKDAVVCDGEGHTADASQTTVMAVGGHNRWLDEDGTFPAMPLRTHFPPAAATRGVPSKSD